MPASEERDRNVPFRRTERPSLHPGPFVIETRCAFCSFFAASTDQKVIEMAEIVHNCEGIREFRGEHS